MIYSHVRSRFEANNDSGYEVLQQYSAVVDWDVDTLSLVPGIELRYLYRVKWVEFELSSQYSYYYTFDIHSTSDFSRVSGASDTWLNKLDADVTLPLKIKEMPLHTGGFYSRMEMFGDLRQGLETTHVNNLNARLVLDVTGRLWKLKWIGIGGSYLWSDEFSGYSIGVDTRWNF